jgi:GNAT superfamily N-acetyltransferase
VDEPTYRPATLGDAVGIYAVLEEVADEIPVLIDTLRRQEALYALVRNCARSGESWVAVEAPDRIVGFLLVEQNETRRHWAEHEVRDMRYAGVARSHRGRGIFTGLVNRALERMVPLTVMVNAANRCEMPRRLATLGFHRDGEHRFLWEPGGNA